MVLHSTHLTLGVGQYVDLCSAKLVRGLAAAGHGAPAGHHRQLPGVVLGRIRQTDRPDVREPGHKLSSTNQPTTESTDQPGRLLVLRAVPGEADDPGEAEKREVIVCGEVVVLGVVADLGHVPADELRLPRRAGVVFAQQHLHPRLSRHLTYYICAPVNNIKSILPVCWSRSPHRCSGPR